MRWIAAALLLIVPTLAHADDGITKAAEPAPAQHLFYVEALGKGGLYGLGYEHALTSRLSLGGAGSFAVVSDQQVLTLSPYVQARSRRAVATRCSRKSAPSSRTATCHRRSKAGTG